MNNDFKSSLPNLVTGIRIICALFLLFLQPFSLAFFIIYAIAGASDLLDGYLARRFNVISHFGATLDSIADLSFFAIVFIVVFPYLDWQLWLIIAFCLVVVIRLLSLIIGYFKFKEFAFLHSYANKLAGFSVFCFPFLCFLFDFPLPTIYLAAIGLISAIEELAINIFSVTIQKNISTIFALKKED